MDDWELSEEAEKSWRGYLKHFRKEIYPMFEDEGVSFDAALTVWFTNRLRNAINDDSADNEIWRQ